MPSKLSKKLSNNDTISLGSKLKARRKELDLTLNQVALIVGCTPQQIQKYESCRSNITIPILLKLCRALRTHPNRFFMGLILAETSGGSADQSLENRLITAFRSVDDEKVKERIVNLVEALVSSS